MKKLMIMSQALTPNYFTYLGGMVSTSAVVGTTVYEFGVEDGEFIGTRHKRIEEEIEKVKQACIKDLSIKAQNAHCDTLYDIRFESSLLYSNDNRLLMIQATASMGIRNFENEIVLGSEMQRYETALVEYQERVKRVRRDFEYNHQKEPVLQFMQECAGQGIGDELLKDLFPLVVDCLDGGFAKTFEGYFNQCSLALLESIFFNQMRSYQGEQLLTLRRKEGFLAMIQYMSQRISLVKIYEELAKQNDYLDIIILHPLLAGYKQVYTKEDHKVIPMIINQLKQTYYHESIDANILSKDDKICRCGRILFNGANCSCGARTKINLASYVYKEKVIQHLTQIQLYLDKHFS